MTHGLLRTLRTLVVAVVAIGALAGAAFAADKLISLDAEDASLPSVLKILAEKGGLNIVTGPGVAAGRISIHMKDVPLDQAVNLVVRAAGLAYERIGNSILVAEARSLKEETGLTSYIVDLKYADANDVKAALKNLAAQIEVDRGGNRMVVVTSPRVISEILGIVAQLDMPARQVMLEARIVEVSTDDVKKLGIDWDILSRQGFIFVEGNYNLIEGPAEQDNATIEDVRMFPNTPGTHDIWKLNNFSRVAKIFRPTLDALIRDGNARVLANPKIATLNGKEASILIGQRIPYETQGLAFYGGGSGGAAGGTNTQVQREEVGIKLRITPLINVDGYITTEITPEVSSVTGFTGRNEDLPIVSTRQATTTVRLKDGNSVIIGGLLSEDKTTSVTKVPLLGQIPGLGVLFQHHSVTTRKMDLIIEVTPRLLPETQ